MYPSFSRLNNYNKLEFRHGNSEKRYNSLREFYIKAIIITLQSFDSFNITAAESYTSL